MYHPVRDSRFEDVWDAINHIENLNCSKSCRWATAATEESPSQGCALINKVILEEDVEELDDRGYDGIHCNRREPVINTTGYTEQLSLLDILLENND